MSTPAAGWTGATGEPTVVLLARHGQTPRSAERRYCGRDDVGLTELGRRQAELTAARLAAAGPDLVVSSPLERCLVTARLAAETAGVPLEICPDLVETDFGDWDGLSFAEAAERDPELHSRWLGDPSVPPPGGESFAVVRARVEGALRQILDAHPGRLVAVVSHVTPIKLVLRQALDAGDALLYRLHLDPASLSEARFHPDGLASVHLVNGTAHLRTG